MPGSSARSRSGCGSSWPAGTAREPRAAFLLGYGITSWLFSLAYLALMLVAFFYFLAPRWGLFGVAGVVLLGMATLRGMFHGFTGGEVRKMIRLRRWRTVA